MIKFNVICDRCRKECAGTTYFTVQQIGGFDINPTNDGRESTETASHNLSTNLNSIFGIPKHYCKDCIDKIRKFMEG